MNTSATLDLAAELNQQIALIAGNEAKMRAAIASLKRIVSCTPKTYAKTADEVYSDFEEALEETKKRINGELPYRDYKQLLNEL